MSSQSKFRLTALAGALSFALSGEAATLVVDSNADTLTAGTLRSALSTIANDCGCFGAPYTISFAFPGLTTIPVNSPLPVAPFPPACTVTIDGYSQPGSVPNSIAAIQSGTNAQPRIILNGAAMTGGTGLVLDGAGSAVAGLVFQNFPGTALALRGANTQARGNFFGVNETATACAASQPNMVGVVMEAGAVGATVGGAPNPAFRNVLGCMSRGIDVSGSDAGILNNLIGTGAGGAVLPNGIGIAILGAGGLPGIDIGTPFNGAGNLISRNTGAGVAVGANRNSVFVNGNDIFLNGSLGIDLGNNGATANTPSANPNPAAPNGGQNYPLVTYVRYDAANTRIDWTLNGFANAGHFVDFHSNPAGLGLDEGARFVSSTTASTDSAGNFSGSNTLAGIVVSPTLTASGPVGTSEFSPPGVLDVSPRFLTFGSVPAGSSSAAQVVTYTNLGSASILIGPPITSGDYAATSTCDGTTPIPANGTCTANVTFNPLIPGLNSGGLDMPTSGTGGDRGIALDGNGVAIPVISPSNPGPVNFGALRVGTASAPVALTFSNSGTGDLAISSVTLAGGSAASFNVIADGCTSAILNEGNPTCTVNVGMTPQAAGSLAANLVVASNDPATPSLGIGLAGTGLAPVLASNPVSPVNFGTVQVGSASAPVAVSFTNSGNGSLTVGSSTLTGAAASSFQVVADGCAGQTLTATPPASCTISLAMQPQSAGALAATLQVSSDATNPVLALSLAGTGSTAPVVAPPIGATPAGPVDFGPRRIGTQSPPTMFTLAPSGPGPVAISSVAPRGTGFSVVSDTCTGATIAQGATPASCAFSVIFAPAFEGAYRTSIQVLSSAANPQLLIDVTGTGTPLPVGRLAASPGSVPFGTQAVGVTTNPQTVQVTNTGTLPVTVSRVRATGDFAQANDCRLLDSGQSCRASVTFTPTVLGERTGNLIVESDATNPQLVVSLQGTASPAPVPIVELNPGAVTFGNTLMGSGGGSTLITLRNSGGASLELGRIYALGDFRVTHNCAASLAPGASCQVTVSFTPSITGSRTGKLVVESNASGGNKEAPLSGTGCRNFGLGTSRLAAPVCK